MAKVVDEIKEIVIYANIKTGMFGFKPQRLMACKIQFNEDGRPFITDSLVEANIELEVKYEDD